MNYLYKMQFLKSLQRYTFYNTLSSVLNVKSLFSGE